MLYYTVPKKMAVFIFDNESSFILAQQQLAESNLASAIVHLHSHTFRLTGPLQQASVEQFMQVYQKIVLSFPPQPLVPGYASPQSRKHKALVERTCRYIEQHLAQPLTLSSISKAMNTNRNSLSKAFKQELNMGVSAWLRLQRMYRARQLLVDTNLSIQEISARLGYPLQANFSTSFKNLFKQSPKQIRQECNDV